VCSSDLNYAFMDMSSYEQLEMNAELIGDDAKYLKEGIDVVVGLYDGRPVSVQIPKKIQYKVTEAPPAVRGDSASGNVTKEITLDNGLKIQAPIFIKEGEEILVNTETGEYSARA
jgi:elongation factor P